MHSFVARSDELLVEEVDGGLVVYDMRSHHAHWMDARTATVWRACRRPQSEAEIAAASGIDVAACAAVLSDLRERGLVDSKSGVTYSRRTVLRSAAKVGVAGAIAAPIVSTVVPVAAAHGSVITGGNGAGNGGGPIPGSVVQLVVSAPAAATAGNPFTLTVTAEDAHGNVVTGYGGTIHFDSSDGAAVLPADRTLTNGTGTFTITLMTPGGQAISVKDLGNPSLTGSTQVTVRGATQLVVSAPSTATAGQPFSVTVTAEDALGNTVAAYYGTVHFDSSDPIASLPADRTLTNGTGTFTITLTTPGDQLISVKDFGSPALTGSTHVTVS